MSLEKKEKKAFELLKANGSYSVLKNIQKSLCEKLPIKEEDTENEAESLTKSIIKIITSKEMQELQLTVYANFYCEKFSEEEIDKLIEFYESPIGQKYASAFNESEKLTTDLFKVANDYVTHKLIELGYSLKE